jgi:D-aminopeptidase
MKVYISADMEGVAGVVCQEQLRPQGFEFQQFRSFMTAEVNAAIEGVREEGATEIVVSDSHGTEMSEAGINALIAGHFGVPVVMMSGDDAAVTEVSNMLGPIEGAVVKWQSSHTSARTLMPEAARSLIKQKAQRGLQRRQELLPFHIEGPLALDLSYQRDKAAELIAYLPNVERIDNHTVRFVGDIVEVSMFIEMALGYPSTFD